MQRRSLRPALRFASLPMGIAAALSAPLAFAQNAPADAAPAAAQAGEAKTLDRIEVTGSRIRRVDAENASPVVTIDRAAIEKTGKLTLGDLVQELPNIAGAATNPQVNNGGGTGASTVDLRGLGSQRTLVLINGRRALRLGGNDGGADVNAIPASAVERIEVLTVGASSVYGSDAVAGVVNFIMRKDFQGVQAVVDYGISSRQDGQREGFSLTFGQVGDKGNVTAGVNYNQFDAVSSGDRDYAKDAQYLRGGELILGGSGRTPRGRISLDDSLAAQFGCSSVSLTPGAAGNSLDDYHCYDSKHTIENGGDAYNFQAVNLVLTPQERTNAFMLGNYQLTDDVSAFLQVYHNKTSSNFALAPLPFDANGDAVTISADSYYNPFGIEFGPGANDFFTRFTSLGQRRTFNATATDQVIAGVEGFLGDTWKWDFAMNYGHLSRTTETHGYVFYQGLADALGPSFLDTDGVVKCGAPGNVVAGCTPLNIFNIDDPQTLQTLQQYAVNPLSTLTYVTKGFEANASGELFQMPAGAAQLAFGSQWRKEYSRSEVEFVTIANEQGQCFVAQNACGSPVTGQFSVSELYGELFLPILKDVVGAKTLNVTLGSRYSDYDLFGSNTSSKLQVEWRPLDDLLLRGTVAEVFRGPSIVDLFGGPAGNAPTATDPCVGYINDPAHASACGAVTGATNIPAGGIAPQVFSQLSGVLSGSQYAGYDLKPEQGKSFDWGLVYDPSWLPGFSVSLDYWRLYLNDNILTIGGQTVLDACYANNESPFCPFIHRSSNGQVNYIAQPTVNLGRLDVDGWDVALRYKLPDTAWGSWNFGFDGSYLDSYDNDQDTTTNTDPVKHLAGTFNKDFGMFSRIRSRLFVNWNMGDWSASWRMRYIGPFKVGNEDVRQGASIDQNLPGIEQDYGSYTIHSLNVGYNMASVNSRVEVGVDNVFDKQPPILYQNNVLNANTDVNTFDTMGRFFFARYTVKF